MVLVLEGRDLWVVWELPNMKGSFLGVLITRAL